MWIPQPQQPGDEPALPPERAQPADVGHAAQPPDHRDVAAVAVAERLHGLAVEPGEDRLGRRTCRPGCRPARRPGPSPGPSSTAGSPRRRPRRSRDARGSSGRGRRGSGRCGRSRRPWPRRPCARTTTRARPPPTARSARGSPPRRRRASSPARGRPRCRTTCVCVRTTTPSRSSWRRADAERPGGYVGRTRSIASTSTIRASCGRIDRKSLRSVSFAISPRAPASSTPVGPPPTSTNVIHAAPRSGSASRSAASNAIRIRRRISMASSMVLRPGAYGAHSSCPK